MPRKNDLYKWFSTCFEYKLIDIKKKTKNERSDVLRIKILKYASGKSTKLYFWILIYLGIFLDHRIHYSNRKVNLLSSQTSTYTHAYTSITSTHKTLLKYMGVHVRVYLCAMASR